ncbi:MAG TPA: LPS assembly lipoprotein LptE [Longimicrobiales bacterium]|nr:LPS assembly lipoprotein LptE [Longimicrobiales bacterium]
MKSSRIRRTSGRRAAEALAGAALLLLAACNYGFEGGGFPSHIRTIYIEPFINETAQFDIDQRLSTRLLEELPGQLGVRPAGREVADAILSGRIVRYDDVAQNYRPGSAGQVVDVLSHEVQIGVTVQLLDVRENVIRWESRGLIGRGQYRPDSQTDREGQRQAIENIIEQVVDGAQSQW